MSPASARERWRLVSSSVRHGSCADLRSTGRISPLTSGHRTLAASSPVSQGGHFRFPAESGRCRFNLATSALNQQRTLHNGPVAFPLHAPPSAKWSRDRVAHGKIGPIESGPRPIVTTQGRIRGRMPHCATIVGNWGGAIWGISGQIRRERVCWKMREAPYVETTTCQNPADR